MKPSGIISFLFLLAFSSILNAQSRTVTISGSNPAYAGREIEFYTYTERIYNTIQSVAKTKVDETGSFKLSFQEEKIQCIYCLTPLYNCYLFAEPGKSYSVTLPPFPTDTDENDNNPFFIPPLWHLLPIPEQTTEINYLIHRFDQEYEPFLDKQIVRYYNARQSREKLDSFTIANRKNLKVADPFFDTYFEYRMAILGFTVNQYSQRELTEKYIKNKPGFPENPAWWEFINLYYDRYFSSISKRPELKDVYSVLRKGSLYSLNDYLKKDTALQNDLIREMVILKEAHKGFYEDELPVSVVSAYCDSIANLSKFKESVAMAVYIKNDITSLMKGNTPPKAFIHNEMGDSIDLSAIQGKYSYICFCSLDNTECLKEFEYLKYIFHKHSKYIDIFVILPKNEKERISVFREENSIPWTFWFSNDNTGLRKAYKVKSYPVFYLLDRTGKLLMSPATFPSANFEQQLFRILKSKGEI